jgi:hypothetical protein
VALSSSNLLAKLLSQQWFFQRLFQSFVARSITLLAVPLLATRLELWSPLWYKTTSVFLEDDLSFLLKSIVGEDFTGQRQQLAVSLVRSASGGNDVNQAYGFSIDALLLINRKFIFCDNLPTFSK